MYKTTGDVMGLEVDNEMPEHDTEYEVIIKQTVISKQLQGRGGVKSHGWCWLNILSKPQHNFPSS